MDVNTEKDLYKGTAFVIFEMQGDSDRVLEKFDQSPIGAFFSFLGNKICCCCTEDKDITHFKGNKIFAQRAPEPTDVYWENMNTPLVTTMKRTICTYLITMLLLGVTFGANLGLNIYKDSLETQGRETTSFTEQGLIRLMSILMSMFVVVVNGILSKVIRLFSVYEKHRTYTAYNLSVASKLTMALFINTAVIPIFANLHHTQWFTNSKFVSLTFQGGLAADIFYRILTIAMF